MTIKHLSFGKLLRPIGLALTGVVSLLAAVIPGASSTTTPPTPISLSNVPLVLVEPTHPQVLFILSNSQSMDGDLSGAIMTGSGTVTSLQNSSSPVNYTVPAGFTPPEQAATGGVAPYTVTSGGVEYDNSASRLNVAKAAIQATITQYGAVTDFGLMDFSTGGPTLYTTWVYYMSNAGGFTFSNTIPSSGNYYANPCYNLTTDTNCTAIKTYYTGKGVSGVVTDRYLIANISSDDPSINDVLYDNGAPTNFDTYNGPRLSTGQSVTSPYPPTFTLANYEAGGVALYYDNSVPNIGEFGTGPTNAGYVPYSTEVWYAERGFGYYVTSQSAIAGDLLVPITTAGTPGNPGTPATPAQLTTYLAKFTSYLAPETNSTSTTEIKALAVQAPLTGPLSQALSYFTGSSKPTPNNTSCTAQRYVVLVTDGLPTEDLSGNYWPPLGSAAATGYGVTASFNTSTGALLSTNDQALTDTITKITALNSAGIETYVIGMGAGVDPVNNPQAASTLTAMAVAGGTSNYFPATTPAAVATQLQAILQLIHAANISTSSAAVDSTSLNTGTEVYQARFTSSDIPYADWTGNLLAFTVFPTSPPLPSACLTSTNGFLDTSSSCADWQAQTNLDALNWNTGRNIVTYNPSTGTGVPFRWTSLSSTQQSLLMTSTTDTLGPTRLNYLRGDTSNYLVNGGALRNRTHILGDIVDSNPLFVGQPNGNHPDSSYTTFVQNFVTTPRTPMVYVGANDGMLHGFRTDTGQEVFAFIPNGAPPGGATCSGYTSTYYSGPNGVFCNLMNLTSPSYDDTSGAHRFYVDGTPSAGDALFNDGTWHTVLVGGLNNGGASIYALDITNPTAATTETAVAANVLWEFTDPNLGYTYSNPVVARISSSSGTQFAAVFGSGYDNSSQTPYLYVVNAQTGSLINSINLCASVNPNPCNAAKTNGLSSPTVISTNGTDVVDRIYVGDLQGHLWVVNISSATPSAWTVSLLFTAEDGSGNPQPITTAPKVTLHPTEPGYLVFFGTGELLSVADVTTTSTQTFYGVWDNLSTTSLVRGNLQPQTITTVSVSTPLFNGQTQVREVSTNTVNWVNQYGWYMDLPQSGERVITEPQLLTGQVMFTTYVPSSNVCTASGSSFLMVVNYATGGAFSQPNIDLYGTGQINSSDQVVYSGQTINPAGISLGTGYSSSPTAVYNQPGSSGNDTKLISQESGSVTKILDRGNGTLGRLSWQQIQ